jgi:hypothetical protein
MSKPRKGNTVNTTTQAPTTQVTEQQTAAETQTSTEVQAATEQTAEQQASAESTEAAAPAPEENQAAEPGAELAAAAAAPAAETSDKLLKPLTEIEKLIEKAKADGDNTIANVVAVCTAYREALHPSKMVDKDILRTHQLAFFRMVRDVLQSPSYYTHGLNVLLSYLREDSDGEGALSVPFMMRGFDDQTLATMPEDNRQLFWGFVTLLTTAAGLNDPKGTYRKVSMKVFQETTKLTPEMKQRLVSFFSS